MFKKISLNVISSHANNNANRDQANNPKTCKIGGAERARNSSQSYTYTASHLFSEFVQKEFELGEKYNNSHRAKVSSHREDWEKIFSEYILKPENESVKLLFGMDIDNNLISYISDQIFLGFGEKSQDVGISLSRMEKKIILEIALDEIKNDKDGFVAAYKKYIAEKNNKNKEEEANNSDASIGSDEEDPIKNKTSKKKDNKKISKKEKAEGNFFSNVVKKFSKQITEEGVMDRYWTNMTGRFLSGVPQLDLESATCRADAFSTHSINKDDDFFAATDELDEAPGAFYLGYRMIHSSCMYKSIGIDYNTFKNNQKMKLDKEEEKILLKCFIKAFVWANSAGKKYSSWNESRPEFVAICIMDNAITFANAFESPIKSDEGYIKPSITALKKNIETMKRWENYESYYFDIHDESQKELKWDDFIDSCIMKLMEDDFTNK